MNPSALHEECAAKAISKRNRQQKAVRPYMRGGSQSRPALPSSPLFNPLLLLSSIKLSSPPPLLLCLARALRQSPASTLQNACLSTFTPPQPKSDYSSNTVGRHLCLSSPRLRTQARQLVHFAILLLKSSKVSISAVLLVWGSAKATERRYNPKTYSIALLGRPA